MLCTHRVRRFVRPLKTPSAMWLIRLSPRFSFSSKPSPTKADSLRRVSWLYDRSLEALNSTSEACGGDLLWWHHQTIKYWILISNRRLIKKKKTKLKYTSLAKKSSTSSSNSLHLCYPICYLQHYKIPTEKQPRAYSSASLWQNSHASGLILLMAFWLMKSCCSVRSPYSQPLFTSVKLLCSSSLRKIEGKTFAKQIINEIFTSQSLPSRSQNDLLTLGLIEPEMHDYIHLIETKNEQKYIKKTIIIAMATAIQQNWNYSL